MESHKQHLFKTLLLRGENTVGLMYYPNGSYSTSLHVGSISKGRDNDVAQERIAAFTENPV